MRHVDCVVYAPQGGGGRKPAAMGMDDVPIRRPVAAPAAAPPPLRGGQKPTAKPMKRLTAAENFYKQAQSDQAHRVAAQKQRSAQNGASGKSMRRPNFLVCYLCGQQFGKASLPIHQPQCYYKRLVEWERGDVETRGARPLHPDEAAKDMEKLMAEVPECATQEETVERFNQMQFESFQRQMVACDNCGRTFFPDRLVIHKRSCHPDASGRGSKPVRQAGPSPVAARASPLKARGPSPVGARASPSKGRPPTAGGARAPSPLHRQGGTGQYRGMSPNTRMSPTARGSPRAASSPRGSPTRRRPHSPGAQGGPRLAAAPRLGGPGGYAPREFESPQREDEEDILGELSPQTDPQQGEHHMSHWDAEVAAAALCESPAPGDTDSIPGAADPPPLPHPHHNPIYEPPASFQPPDAEPQEEDDIALALALAHEEVQQSDAVAAPHAQEQPFWDSPVPEVEEDSPPQRSTSAYLRRAVQAPPPEPQLLPCPNCNRRFVPKSLEIHTKVCKGPSPSSGGQAQARLIPCRHCSRTFAHDRVERHEECCVKNKPTFVLSRKKEPPPPQTRPRGSVRGSVDSASRMSQSIASIPSSEAPPSRRSSITSGVSAPSRNRPQTRQPRAGAPCESAGNYAAVSGWLKDIGLSVQVAAADLEREGIDGDAVNCCAKEVGPLCEALGITRFGDQQKLRKALGIL
eukprot:Hpha_TRINITY_DN15380_c1_g4::TRINITY_DN15380_c1_g4_i1::g.89624::m.89624